jgi:branched-chain amino acid transport system substrate-binding protein
MVRDDINSKGGIKIGGDTYKIEVIAEDNYFTSEGAAAAANKLLEKKVDISYACIVSHTTLAAQAVFEPAHVLTINTANDDRVISESKLGFRVFWSPTLMVPPELKWVAKEHPEVKRFAKIDGNTESAKFNHKKILEFMPRMPFELVDAEFFEPGTVDFYPLLTKILAQKPDLIYSLDAVPAEWALIHKQARELGYKGLFMYGTDCPDPELLQVAGKEVAEGSIGVSYAVRGANASEAAKAYVKSYEAAHGTFAGGSIMVSAPMYAILQAMQDIGSIDSVKVAAELELGKEYAMPCLGGEKGSFGGKETFGRNAQWYGPLWLTAMQDGVSVPIYKIPMEDLLHGWD